LIAGVTTGTPIHVFVPNTDQRGNVSIVSCSEIFNKYKQPWPWFTWLLKCCTFGYFFRIIARCQRPIGLPMRMQPMTWSMVSDLFRYWSLQC